MEEMNLQQPDLIGREEELSQLKQSLGDAIAGKGSTIFISGEAGIGKTRLVSELIKEAEAKDVQLIRGWCLAESLEPLMPIKTALREAGLFHLISGDPPPLVVSAYLTDDSGILISKHEREELDLDPHIFASMLTAVGNFVKDSMGMVDKSEMTGGLNNLGYKEFNILIEEYRGLHLATVTKGSLSEFLVHDMRDSLAEIQRSFGDILSDWDGDLDRVKGIESIIARLITCGKYDGKFLVEDAKIRQENLFDNILMGIQRISTDKPLLLFIDDLQWVDPTTLNLLHYLSRNTRKNNIMILGTYRPEDIVQSYDGKIHQLESAMQNMGREDLLHKIELERLGAEETNEIISSVLGQNNFEPDFFERIYKETEGTPFYILEVVKLLIEDNTLVQNEDNVWELDADIKKLDIPTKVYDVIKRRLNKLIKEQKKMLDCASVVGEEFQSEIIEKVIGLNRMQLLENLSEIEKTHNLIHYLSDKYRFDHAKIKEVLYNGIGGELRKEYHRIIADTILEINKENIDDAISDLAYHYFKAGDEKAGQYLFQAGNQVKERFANEEAIRFYTDGLGVIKDEEIIKEIHESLGDIHLLIGEYDNALENYQSAIEKENDIRKKADLHRKIADVYRNQDKHNSRLEECNKGLELLKNEECIETARLLGAKGWAILTTSGDWKESKELFFEGLRIAEKFRNKKEIAQAHNNIGILYIVGDIEYKEMKEALIHYEKALKIREEIGDVVGLSNTLLDIGQLYHNSANLFTNEGDLQKAIDYYNRSLEIKQKIGDKEGISGILYLSGIFHRMKGDLNKALELHEQSLKIRETIGIKGDIAESFYIAESLAHVGGVYRLKGDFDRALEYYEQSLKINEKIGRKLTIARSFWRIGNLFEVMGDLDKALEYYEQGLEISMSKEITNKGYTSSILSPIGNVYKHKGKLDKSLEYYNRSLEINSEIGNKWLLVEDHCGLTEVYLELGNTQNARMHAEKAFEISTETETTLQECGSHQALGMVFRESREWDKAIEEFEKAKRILENSIIDIYEKKIKLARISYEYGLLYKAMGEPDKAKEHLNKALKGYTELSNKLWTDKTQKALEELKQ